MKKLFIPMSTNNVGKIINGKKTTTLRSLKQIECIGLNEGESGIVNFNGFNYVVNFRGYLTIDEAGGKEIMLKCEGLNSINDCLYKQTINWFNGKGKLGVYDIRKQ